MNLIPDTFIQPNGEVRRGVPFLKILGAILLVAVAVSAIIYYEVWSRTGSVSSVTPTGSNMQQATTTIVVSPAEKQKLLDQMSQLVSATGTAKQTTSQTTTMPAPVTSPAEKKKLFDAMQQKVK